MYVCISIVTVKNEMKELWLRIYPHVCLMNVQYYSVDGGLRIPGKESVLHLFFYKEPFHKELLQNKISI